MIGRAVRMLGAAESVQVSNDDAAWFCIGEWWSGRGDSLPAALVAALHRLKDEKERADG